MASSKDPDGRSPRFPDWLDPELIVYALMGALLTAWGMALLARWSVQKWMEGQRVVVAAAVAGVIAAAIVTLLLSRARHRWFRVVLILASVRFVSYVWAAVMLERVG